LNLNIQTNFEKFQIWKCFKNFILIYPNLTSVQKYFKPLIFESKILFKIQKKEFLLQPPWLSAHFVARPIFVSPSLPPKPALSARPSGPVRRLPPPASIGSHLWLPSAPPPLRSWRRAMRHWLPPSSTREEPNRSAVMPPSLPKLNQRRPVSSSPFNSFETDEE
jgi:hypothetical protein